MTIPTLMMYPSVWMQKTFFQLAEGQRGRKIGDEDPYRRGDSQIALRVMAVAHAALQFLYASLMVVPLCIATAVATLIQPLSTGFFTENGKVLERLAVGVAAAVGSLLLPIGAAVVSAFVPSLLDSYDSPTVGVPIFAHALLFSLVLPSMEELVAEKIRSFTNTYLMQSPYQIGSFLTNVVRNALPMVEHSVFRWRILMPVSVLKGLEDGDVSGYDRVFDTSSGEFGRAFAQSIKNAFLEVQEADSPLLI